MLEIIPGSVTGRAVISPAASLDEQPNFRPIAFGLEISVSIFIRISKVDGLADSRGTRDSVLLGDWERRELLVEILSGSLVIRDSIQFSDISTG